MMISRKKCDVKIILKVWLLVIGFGVYVNAQNCHCTVQDVVNNTVESCTKSIGDIVVVSSVNEFWSALRRANANGGNMTILFEDGTYEIASTSSYPYITASNMVFRSKNGLRDQVILTGGGMRNVNPLVEIVLSVVGDNVTIADLTIREVGNHGISIVGEGLVVHNVRIQNTYEQMIKGNRANPGPTNGLIQCSLMEYPGGIGPQWYIGGIDIHRGQNWIVRDNVFRHIESPSMNIAEHAVHFWDESANILVERNVIVGCDRGIGFGLGSSPVDGGIIRNNMIVNDGQGIFNDVGIGLESTTGVKVYNNSIHIEYQNAIEYRFQATRDIEIINNVTNRNIRSRSGGQATVNDNVTNGMVGWYEDVTSGNLRLTGSIATLVDRGMILSDVADDIDQSPRPLGNGYDIGAHEYKISTSVEKDKDDDIHIDIWPNPSTDIIYIDFNEESIVELSIMDINGHIVMFHDSPKDIMNVNVKKWERGIYIISVVNKLGKRNSHTLLLER